MRELPAYRDPELVAKTTQYLVDKGDTVLQIHRLAPTQDEHIAELLKFFAPKYGTTVLDAGCGVGAVSAGMKALRPDLNFILLNNSEAQITHCGDQFLRLVADMHAMPLKSQSVDAVMVCYALGHTDLIEALTEFARVTRTGGMFYLYDLTCDSAEHIARLEDEMFYTASSVTEIAEAAYSVGFSLSGAPEVPDTYMEHFYDKMDKANCDRLLSQVVPVLFRFVKV